MYDIEKIHLAKSVPDAIAALVKDPSAVVICGGSDVLVKIREGKLAGCSLVSIHGIRELEGVSLEPDGTIVIGRRPPFPTSPTTRWSKSTCPRSATRSTRRADRSCGTSARSAATSATA